MDLKAFRFRHIGQNSAETFPFYAKFIRGFLRWHRGDAVWVKGGMGKKDAYIVVIASLSERVSRMLRDELRCGGRYEIEEVNPHYIIYEANVLERETVGWLKTDNVELGDPDEINCPKEGYRKLSVQDWCFGRKRVYGDTTVWCDAWDGRNCIYPKMMDKAIELRKARQQQVKTVAPRGV
jgi:hypothetical protein